MKKTKATLINRTDVLDKTIMDIVSNECEGKPIPDFYLICQTPNHLGVSITNLDKPCVVIVVHSRKQFIGTLQHELIHLMQHQQDYASEEEVELVITDKHRTINDR